jgi:hypothetical protein
MDKLDKADRAGSSRTVAGTLGTIGSAFVALFMLGAITFGATVIRPMTATPASEDQTARADRADRAGHGGTGGGGDTTPDKSSDEGHKFVDVTDQQGNVRYEPKPKPTQEPAPTPKPTEQPAAKPAQAEPTAKPTPKPTAKPAAPKPVTTSLALDVWAKDGKFKLGWSKFIGEGFAYYKVVRSTDAEVSWPTGSGDELRGAISDPYSPWMADNAPCGVQFHYRVFAVKHSESGYATLAASNVKPAFMECHEAPPPPTPTTMAFGVVQSADGIQLSWEQCTSDGFVYYKVVRSATNSNPVYPLNDGTELLAAIGDPGVIAFTDHGVAPGQTWFYRVLSFADLGYGKVLVAQTDAVSITVL